MGRNHTQSEQPEDPSRRRFIGKLVGTAAGLGASALISCAGGQFGGGTAEPDYKTEQLNYVENIILDETWWGQQMVKFNSTIPESDIIIKPGHGDGMYDPERNKVILKYHEPANRRSYFQRGVPIFTERKCHEVTHYTSYNNTSEREKILPISELHSNMFFGNFSYIISETGHLDKELWKNRILKAVLKQYTDPDICELFKKFGVEALVDNHFDDIFDIYYSGMKNGKEFYQVHREASMMIGKCSNKFDKNRKIYPELREFADGSRRWIKRNGLYLEEADDGIRLMLQERKKSYQKAAEIASGCL